MPSSTSASLNGPTAGCSSGSSTSSTPSGSSRRDDGEPAVLAQRDVVSSSRSRAPRCRSAGPSSWSSTRTLVRLILMACSFRGSVEPPVGDLAAAAPCPGRGTCSGPPGGCRPARRPRARRGAARPPAATSRGRACVVSRAQSSNSVWPSRSVQLVEDARRVGSARALKTSRPGAHIGKCSLACQDSAPERARPAVVEPLTSPSRTWSTRVRGTESPRPRRRK